MLGISVNNVQSVLKKKNQRPTFPVPMDPPSLTLTKYTNIDACVSFWTHVVVIELYCRSWTFVSLFNYAVFKTEF